MIFQKSLGQMIVMDLDDPGAPITGCGCRPIPTSKRRCGPPDQIDVTFPAPYGTNPAPRWPPFNPRNGYQPPQPPAASPRDLVTSSPTTPATPGQPVSLFKPWGTFNASASFQPAPAASTTFHSDNGPSSPPSAPSKLMTVPVSAKK